MSNSKKDGPQSWSMLDGAKEKRGYLPRLG